MKKINEDKTTYRVQPYYVAFKQPAFHLLFSIIEFFVFILSLFYCGAAAAAKNLFCFNALSFHFLL